MWDTGVLKNPSQLNEPLYNQEMLLLLFFFSTVTWADENTDLNEIISLKEKLPQAICDEAVVSKLPSLEILGLPGSKLGDIFILESDFPQSEDRIMHFLLGENENVLESPYSHFLTKNSTPEVKKKVSLEICTSLVSQEKFKKLFRLSPSRFFNVNLAGDFDPLSKREHFRKKEYWILQDFDKRFSQFHGKWWVPGWIEPRECVALFLEKRTYLRVVHPVTEKLISVSILNKKGIPLGSVFPGGEALSLDFKTLKTRSESLVNQQKKQEFYQLALEIAAYKKIQKNKKSSNQIIRILNIFKYLMKEFQRDPSSPQVGKYISPQKLSDKDYGIVFDAPFFKALAQAKLSVQFFNNDLTLHRIYLDFVRQ